jgi:hypothetical protein
LSNATPQTNVLIAIARDIVPWLITATKAYSMVETGSCYDVFCGYDYVGTVCLVACDLEFGDGLWSPGHVRSAKMAVKVLIQQADDMPLPQVAD